MKYDLNLKTATSYQLLLVVTFLAGAVQSINVRVSNITIGEQKFNLINSDEEDIYKVVYNSTVI